MRRNTKTALPRKRSDGMRGHDALPPELRAWVHSAALPWSARSVLRIWTRALREAGGDAQAARTLLDAAEARMIARDAATIWGPGYPAPTGGQQADHPGTLALRR
ncbi:DUF6525 family protein [Halodurantibacterium flavum]|uniref:DUF6525 family protein n=1 Tax=Halodurantibacterium flavum TaxID=1382802 RepID=A0ABW4S5L6_9RHOB